MKSVYNLHGIRYTLKLQSFSYMFLLAISSMDLPSLIVFVVAYCLELVSWLMFAQLVDNISAPGCGVLRWVPLVIPPPHLPGERL